MKSSRKGLGKGRGTGYKNMIRTDPLVHHRAGKHQRTYSTPTERKMAVMSEEYRTKLFKLPNGKFQYLYPHEAVEKKGRRSPFPAEIKSEQKYLDKLLELKEQGVNSFESDVFGHVDLDSEISLTQKIIAERKEEAKSRADNWNKISEFKWKNKSDEIILDKLDGKWDVLLYKNGSEEDGNNLFSSSNLKEAQSFAKDYMKKH